MGVVTVKTRNPDILFFILIFLLLFYDSRPLYVLRGISIPYTQEKDSSILFFILVFLLLFY